MGWCMKRKKEIKKKGPQRVPHGKLEKARTPLSGSKRTDAQFRKPRDWEKKRTPVREKEKEGGGGDKGGCHKKPANLPRSVGTTNRRVG